MKNKLLLNFLSIVFLLSLGLQLLLLFYSAYTNTLQNETRLPFDAEVSKWERKL